MNIKNKEMYIKKVKENFEEESFLVMYKDIVLIKKNTYKSCVLFIAKNKEFII